MRDEDVVSERLVNEYRATLAPHLADVPAGAAPLAIHWCLAPPAAPMAALGEDGHAAKGEFLPPVPLPRRMWAGGSVETLAPLRVGDRVLRTSTIDDVTLKEGRSGALCFVAVQHELSTELGPAIRERHDIVYRESSSRTTAPAGRAVVGAKVEPSRADKVWTIETSPVLLFRYSALTFNGHRIHYDHPYVTGVEGYAGLVVHGPLQASLLFNLAASLGGSVPRLFDYRGVAPLIVGTPLRVCGKREATGEVKCWTETDEGVKMDATATWS
ncbi:MAG: MaoC family dehydratase N-terminal domain-containing protein [Betaproteobacteria bacterium]|nr:MaoC family dehydratase N-terminal domain-containing protein [Betaproteobacteria bacterium]